MADTRNNIRFLRTTDDIGVLAAGATVSVDLKSIRQQFGDDLNTIILKNGSTEELSITLDGEKAVFVDGGDGLNLDWQDNIKFTFLEITNEDGANATSANEIRISVGRTGNNG